MRGLGPNLAITSSRSKHPILAGVAQRMRVAVNELVPVPEPQIRVQHEQILAMFLHPGSMELGFRRSEMARLTYNAGEMLLCHRHVERWIRTDETQVLSLAISDTALRAACDEGSADTEFARRGAASGPSNRCARLGRGCGKDCRISEWAAVSGFRRAGACRGTGR
jgi:hypothetical protein